jgi:hypothetical protein
VGGGRDWREPYNEEGHTFHSSSDIVNVSGTFAVLLSSTYLFRVGVEGFYFHLIIVKHTPQSVEPLWTRDRPVTETRRDMWQELKAETCIRSFCEKI